ncbi:hypothetical protein KEM56_002766, partial [Ascosphaera pollenicola]
MDRSRRLPERNRLNLARVNPDPLIRNEYTKVRDFLTVKDTLVHVQERTTIPHALKSVAHVRDVIGESVAVDNNIVGVGGAELIDVLAQ